MLLILQELKRKQTHPHGHFSLAASVAEAIKQYLEAKEESQKTWILTMLMATPKRRDALLRWMNNEGSLKTIRKFVSAHDYLFIHYAVLAGDITFTQDVREAIKKYNQSIEETSLCKSEEKEKKLYLNTVHLINTAITAACQFNNTAFITKKNGFLRDCNTIMDNESFKIIIRSKNIKILTRILEELEITKADMVVQVIADFNLENDLDAREYFEYCRFECMFYKLVQEGVYLDWEATITALPISNAQLATSDAIQAAQTKGKRRAIEKQMRIKKIAIDFIIKYVQTDDFESLLTDFMQNSDQMKYLYFIMKNDSEICHSLLSAHNHFLLRYLIMTEPECYEIVKAYCSSVICQSLGSPMVLAYEGGNLKVLQEMWSQLHWITDTELNKILPFLHAVSDKQDFHMLESFIKYLGSNNQTISGLILGTLLDSPLIRNNIVLFEFITAYQYEFVSCDVLAGNESILKRLENARDEQATLQQSPPSAENNAKIKAIELFINKFTQSDAEHLYTAHQNYIKKMSNLIASNSFYTLLGDVKKENLYAALIQNNFALLYSVAKNAHFSTFFRYLENEDICDVLLIEKNMDRHPHLIKYLVHYKYTQILSESQNYDFRGTMDMVIELLQHYVDDKNLNSGIREGWIKGLSLAIKEYADLYFQENLRPTPSNS